jgi:glucuronoarabinoxylan endo-1,4-beta-xylanase
MSLKGLRRTLFLLVFLPLASAYGDTNILVNPGFENGTTGWSDRNCSITAVSTPVHSGSGSAKVYGRTATWQGIKQSMFGKMENGKTYQISGWVRLENAPSDTVTVSFEQQDDSGTKYHNVATVTATNSDWVQLSGSFKLDITGTLSVLDVYFEGPAPGVNFYVDDANVYGPELAPPKPVPIEPNATGLIDVNTRHQKIEGFGAAAAYYTRNLIQHKQKAQLYNLLFKELHPDILRLRNTYDISPADFYSSTEAARDAKVALGGNLKILISSWSPPTSLKSNPNLVGGTLAKKDGKYVYDEFAKWWYDSLVAYAKAGVKADYITLQNELNYEAKWESCRFAPKEDSNFPGFDVALDTVWKKLNTEMGQAMPKILAPETSSIGDAQDYIDKLNDVSHVYGYAHHLYDSGGLGSTPDRYISKMKNFKLKYSSKPLFQTEYSLEPNTWTGAMNTAILMFNALTVEDVAAYLYWDLFWGPGSGMVSLNDPCTYTINPVYYAFKQYSAFTDSGWQRVETSTDNPGLRIAAFISPDNQKLTIVLINISADTDITLNFSLKGFSIAKGEVYRSSKTEKCVHIGSINGPSPLKLPANSITTLALSAG